MNFHRSLTVTLIALMLLLSACTAAPAAEAPAADAPAEGGAVVKVLAMQQAGYTPDEMDEIASSFSEQNPDVDVEITYLSYDEIYDKLVTSMATPNPAFDVFLVDDPWYTQFASAEWLLDITDRVSDEYKDGILDSAWNVSTVDDAIYGMPWMIDAKMFYYNTDLLAEAGYDAPPVTWEELAEMGATMQEMGLVDYPIIWSWAQAEAAIVDYVLLVEGMGGKVFDENGAPVFNDEAGVATLTWMVESVENNISNPSSIAALEEDVRSVFSQGDAAFALNWPYMYELSQFNEEESAINGSVGLGLIPVFEAGQAAGLDTVTTNGSMGFSIAANSANADAAWDYLEYLTSKDIQMEYAAHLPPIWESAYEAPDLDTLKSLSPVNEVLVPAFSEQYPAAAMRPRLTYYTDASTILQLALQQALTGQKTPQEALDDAAAEINEIANK